MWTFHEERLNVRPADASYTDAATCNLRPPMPETNLYRGQSRSYSSDVTPVKKDTNCKLDCAYPSVTREDYTDGKSGFWADVPHHTFIPAVRQRRKPRRNCSTWSVGVSSEFTKRRRCKKKKKKSRIPYLVSVT